MYVQSAVVRQEELDTITALTESVMEGLSRELRVSTWT